MMRVEVDTDKCIGSGVCALVAGDVFDQRDDDGVVILLAERPAEEHHDSVYEAATRCPAAVIEVHAAG
ncbi:ferredoxin [Dactylosporangium sp. NPDC005555]|uniref:ferredoxin n=1 Tax=Dactylosporangium sp. NPDC005555 TaxID=3154889 RepID=UPI0033B7CAD9